MKRNGLVRKLFLFSTFAGMALCGNIGKHEAVATEKAEKAPYTLKAEKDNPVDKYAVIVVGGHMKNLSTNKNMLENHFWINGAHVYKYLKEMGFNHIYFFYNDGKPDFSEKMIDSQTRKNLKKKFKGKKAWHAATYENLERIIDKVSKRIDKNDIFVMAFSTHGDTEDLSFYNPHTHYPITASELENMLCEVKAGFSLLYVDACKSGAFIKKLHLEDYVIISSTEGEKSGWGDRWFDNMRYFFRNLRDSETDMDVDGKITILEAHEKGKKDAIAHLKRIKNYLLTKLEWDEKKDPESEIKSISITPTMVVGKNVSSSFYIIDLWE